jgi:hypothetical protein
MTTINDIYAAINPLPARLSAKGKVNPLAEFQIEANARMRIIIRWKKYGAVSDWENDYHALTGESFDECLQKADALINGLPSADQDRLQQFMKKLGNLIDVGKDEGISVDFLNPLLDTMKRLSENVITYQPGQTPITQEKFDDLNKRAT